MEDHRIRILLEDINFDFQKNLNVIGITGKKKEQIIQEYYKSVTKVTEEMGFNINK